MTSSHRFWLYTILLAYLALAVIYSIVTPLFEASDELWHYPMVKYLADNNFQLPPQDPANPAPWRQEGSQPPLYYMMAAALTGWIDTSDMDAVRRVNPHADIGIVRPDGNLNMMVHITDAESFPWRGTALAVHLARFFSIALGLGTVLVTYTLAREILPEHPTVALAAAALNAFLPMFLFISGSVNNDNLSNLLGNLLTLLVVRLLKTHQRPSLRAYVILGVCTGAGLLAKLNLGFFIPVIALALLLQSIRLKDWRPLIIGGIVSGGLTILIAGWWYWHNWQLYNDPTGLDMFLQVVGRRAIPANLAQIWSERHSFTQAYWGFFGGVNLPYPEVLYLVFNIMGGLGLLGALLFVANTLLRRQWSLERWLPASITLLWPLVTFISYLRWTAETPASQGRLIFVALSSLSIWMIFGLVWWLPSKRREFIALPVLAFFALVALLTPFLLIAPAYARPAQVSHTGSPLARFTEPAAHTGVLAVLDAAVQQPTVTPESYVMVDLTLTVQQPLTDDWSLFVHLVTPDGVIVGQRDVYPGGGTLATSDLPAGRTWLNPVAIWVPTAAYAPQTLNIVIGWYQLQTGERMTLPDGSETMIVGSVQILPRADAESLDVPNPLRINFAGQIELVGYALTDLSPTAGDTIELTLYWRALRKLDTDYKVFANILDPQTLTKYAASDGMPVNWQAPTTTWEVGTIIRDTHTLTVDPNAPPGIYETEIGLYAQSAEGSFQRLRIITPDGGMANDFFTLTRVRIMSPETE